MLMLPNGVYHGWKCIGVTPSLVINVPNVAYNPSERDEHRLGPHGMLEYEGTHNDG